MKKILFLLLTMVCFNCCTPKKVLYQNSDNTVNNFSTENCSWVYKGEILYKKEVERMKTAISLNQKTFKIRTVSTDADTLKKYNIKRSCVVIVE